MTVMRMKGKPHEVRPGCWSEWPQTLEDAMAQKTVYYNPCDGIRLCAHTTFPLVYTLTGIIRCCALQAASDEYTQAVFHRGEPIDPNVAIARGLDYYWRMYPGKYCGHTGKTTLDGKCYVCMQEKKNRATIQGSASTRELSPRLVAKDKGEKWYMPKEGDLCRNGHHALRRVDNGTCKECEAAARAAAKAIEPEPEIPIYRQFPEMIIGFKEAKALGFKHYRTGEPCTAGHTGWRYVSTRNCLTCMGRG